MSISIYNFHVYKTTYESGSVSEAADKLFISQSAISHQIRFMEESLGVRLFEKKGRKIAPTKIGHLFYKHANEILLQFQELQASIRDFREGRSGDINIAGSIIPGTYLLPKIVSTFKEISPNVNVRLHVYHVSEMIREIVNGVLDLGITTVPVDNVHLLSTKILTEEIIIVCAPDAPEQLIPKSIDELADKPFVCAPKENQGRKIYDQAIAQYGIARSNVVMEVGHPEGVKQAVRAGLGLGMSYRLAVAQDIKLGLLKEIELEGLQMSGDIYLVHRRKKHFLPIEEVFINFIKREMFKYTES